jgi:hypothetical protein
MPEPTTPPETRYRIVCYELENDQQTVIFDATARGFILITGTIDKHGAMHGRGTHAAPLALALRRRPAHLIVEDKQHAD